MVPSSCPISTVSPRLIFHCAHHSGERGFDRINGFVRLHFAKRIVQFDRIAGLFQQRHHLGRANAFAHDRNGDAFRLTLWCRDLAHCCGVLARVRVCNFGFFAAGDSRLYRGTFVSGRGRALDRGRDAVDVWQGGVFVDRIVTDHDVAFADQNRRTDHRVPEIGFAADMGDDHLTNAAIFACLPAPRRAGRSCAPILQSRR